jgi:uncharacterized membrane protein
MMTGRFDPWSDEGSEILPQAEGPSRLLAVELDDALRAQEALLASLRLHQRQAIRIEDAAIVAKDASGRIRIHQTRDVGPGQGAMVGTWLGMFAGLLFMAPLVGAALGAAIGGIWAKLRDIGISDREMKEMGENLVPGSAALFLLFEPLAPTTLVREMHRFNGKVLRSTLPDDLTGEISAALAEEV